MSSDFVFPNVMLLVSEHLLEAQVQPRAGERDAPVERARLGEPVPGAVPGLPAERDGGRQLRRHEL